MKRIHAYKYRFALTQLLLPMIDVYAFIKELFSPKDIK